VYEFFILGTEVQAKIKIFVNFEIKEFQINQFYCIWWGNALLDHGTDCRLLAVVPTSSFSFAPS
jgi:hypothetical protein